ncbi:hypothetical protein BEP19_00875 [Ammoniphilus oxalaticus]|uniref:Uncharacterized protein n=1 Tax=Ammoniphilus oxalaticus TaxID=66863 RepID=A0A419SMK2_9BACL|nr:hypothetical protein [Ammoniphilus oxalaticus]RKD25530.1 hypothetical protein BEP19_00875 [Ammoniphilus oxalaticus]
MKKTLWALVVLCLLAAPFIGQAETPQDEWRQQIVRWTEQLAAGDDRFNAFPKADRRWQSVGTNRDDWVVTFEQSNRPIGYLIVGEEERALRLLEYGLGAHPLFTEQPFVPLPSDTKTPFYAGLHSVWITDDGLIDAKSGEHYPQTAKRPSNFKPIDPIYERAALTAVQLSRYADNTQPWIKPEGKITDEPDLIEHLDKGLNLSYVAHLFEGEILAPFATRGYHRWGKSIYVELEDDGSRFLPVKHALQWGVFYP